MILTLYSPCAAYLWPSPNMDDLESARWDAAGYNVRTSITGGLGGPGCSLFFRGANKGRSNAADWIRTAFHDMATYDPVTGTGGMDASIRFSDELARAENAGTGFSNTVSFFRGDPGRYLSMADVLALALVYSVENCGGPEVDFRGGRIDASGPNLPGVPEPQQDLNSHLTAFERMGFNREEMIGLVACGHTIGGVQHTALPDIVPELNDPNNEDSNALFDSTGTAFDNNVARDYMAGTTSNPLVMNTDDTFNSDKRIFSSDGNATMAGFARSAQGFAETCSRLFSRMIDVVPRGVQLTEVIAPLPVKPQDVELMYSDTGKLTFSGQVRLWNPTENPSRIVNMVWADRNGTQHTQRLLHTPDMVGSAAGGRYRSEWYTWDVVPSANTSNSVTELFGITGMHFEIAENSSGTVRVEDQQGHGFPVSDAVMFSTTSCKTSDGWPSLGRYDVAVRHSQSRVYIDSDSLLAR
ncbi:heme peroxidase [Exidia glandulosa HHB12029]|uniref:Peroxidase n=1 Tax=Exidia glandulosa HHB12029 TaxID=1314781 RepID=A0A165C2L0_EXIGL|nr:heme peroxidase [Exidia glandulosa HHB12029]